MQFAPLSDGAMDSCQEEQRKRCVSCNTLEPKGGKFLHCLHIVCPSCLKDNIARGGGYECCLCWKKTLPLVKGADLAKQLSDCRWLYGAGGSTGTNLSARSGDCDFCTESEATKGSHTCTDCSGALLCPRHAEEHRGARIYAGHYILELKGGKSSDASVKTAAGSSARNAWPCFLHDGYNVTRYCATCDLGVCKRCEAVGHQLHSNNVWSVASTVYKHRIMLARAANCCPILSKTASGGNAISQQIEEVERDLRLMQGHAEEASAAVDDAFTKAEDILKARKEELLTDVIQKSWELRKPLEERLRKLSILEGQCMTADDLTRYLAAGKSSYRDVILLSAHVHGCLNDLQTAVEKAHGSENGRLSVDVCGLSEFQGCVNGLFDIHTESIDIFKSAPVFPANPYIGEEFNVTVALSTCSGRNARLDDPCSEVKAVLINPSGQRQPLTVAIPKSDDNSKQLSFNILLKPTLQGEHSLEMSRAKDVQVFPFTVKQSCSLFDSSRCSPAIALSGDHRKATCGTDQTLNGYVFSAIAAASCADQCLEWTVKINHCCTFFSSVAVGVAVIDDLASECAGTGDFFGASTAYYWTNSGDCHIQQRSRPPSSYRESGGQDCGSWWRIGDVIKFTLDHKAAALELHILRTGVRREIVGLRLNKPLVPVVGMRFARDEVELV